MSRIRTLRAGRSRTATLAAQIRTAAGSNSRKMVNVVRLLPDGQVLAYDWRPALLPLSDVEQWAISELMHATRRDIDWSVSHDYELTTGMLRRSPAAGERGHDPVAEGVFGNIGPVFLPRPGEGRRAA